MKLVILDRDGVINRDSDNYIRSADEWIELPGSAAAIAKLNHAGYTVAVATNQSGLGRNYFDLATLEQMHQKMHDALEREGGQIDYIAFCPHQPEDNCTCRKPLAGMLERILKHYPNTQQPVWMVGDSLRDLESAWAIDMPAALVRTGKGQRSLDQGKIPTDTPVFDDLAAFVDWLLTEQ
ncbi:MAG: D-glycero-beta-D-manno-heptose 1,7-bisphosphate 7-phosphatase [Pseudomonadales bacterium]